MVDLENNLKPERSFYRCDAEKNGAGRCDVTSGVPKSVRFADSNMTGGEHEVGTHGVGVCGPGPIENF